MDELRFETAVVAGYDVGRFAARLSRRCARISSTAYAAETKPSPGEHLATPTTILWQDQDAIFPYRRSDQLDVFFQNYTSKRLKGIGHLTPLEATDRSAEAINQRLAS